MDKILTELAESIMEGNQERAVELTNQALAAEIPAGDILANGLISGMDVVGERFKQADIFIPEVLYSAKAMQAATDIISPLLAESGFQAKGKVILGTVKGDIHDIGKRLVAIMLAGAGFEVIDLGIDVPPERFAEETKARDAHIVAKSALLTVTMPAMKATMEALESAGLGGKVKILIGGATVTQGFADEIGADGYAPDAAGAASIAKELLNIS
jgi:5-methyltetrahydrofolate--homocysteine methyltransferase